MSRDNIAAAPSPRRPADEAPRIAEPDTLAELVARGALFFCSHSGGKDSQAMYAVLRRHVPADQIVVLHADLGRFEWPVQDHIRATIDHDLVVVRAGKDFADMVRRRNAVAPDKPSWPSARFRQCTSDLKVGPLYKAMRRIMAERGTTLAVNAMGLRAEESAARKRRAALSLNKELSKAGREVHDYLPIQHYAEHEVWAAIRDAGQAPHEAYAAGNERLSCAFCIMGCPGDLAHGAERFPALFAELVALEDETNSTVFAAESLAQKAERGRQLLAQRRRRVAAGLAGPDAAPVPRQGDLLAA